MTRRPRSVGSFFVSRACDSANERAVASSRSMSSRSRSAIESRCRRSRGGATGPSPTTRSSVITVLLVSAGDQENPVELVDLEKLDLYALAARRRKVLADVVGPDRKLAVAAVGEHRQLDAFGPAVLEQRVDRGADRPSGVEDVVDEDHGAPFELEVESRVTDDRLRPPRSAIGADMDVVAVKGDVELAQRELDPGALLDEPAQALGDRHAARVDTDERDVVEILVPFDDLVRDAAQRPRDRLGVEQKLRRRADGMVRHSTPFRPRWTGLKGRSDAQPTRRG